MKTKIKLVLLLSLISILLPQAHGTAIYDVTNSVTLQFSHPWVSVAPNTDATVTTWGGQGIGRQETAGDGEFTANVSESNWSNGTTFTQLNRAWGSAGNSALDISGSSSAYSSTYNLFTFDFGSTPTNFTVSVLDWAYGFGYSTDQPRLRNSKGTGEDLGGSVFYQLIFDNSPGSVNYSTNFHPFYDLTGVHTFRFGIGAETGAVAVYPFEVPDTGSSLALLSISVVALGAFHTLRRVNDKA